MSTEATLEKTAAPTEISYTHKSFELVFSNFCKQYEQRLNDSGVLPTNGEGEPLGLRRLEEVAKIMGDSPSWEAQEDDPNIKHAIILSGRYLAWHTIMGSVTQRYIDKVKATITREKHSKSANGGSRANLGKLYHERAAAVSLLLAQNHALRDFFDSGLSETLGNDSPRKMDRLLTHVPHLTVEQRKALVEGISFEIASKRQLESLNGTEELPGTAVAYGSNDQDARGGDLVLQGGEDILFIDIKSSMPQQFSNGEESTPEDYQKGYKWLDGDDREHKAVVWAYQQQPVESDKFSLNDPQMAHNLEMVAKSIHH